jgi:glutathione S-transferase
MGEFRRWWIITRKTLLYGIMFPARWMLRMLIARLIRESNAIIEYLVAKYDTDRTISFADFENELHMRQWLYFQASGQGPYFGQAVWFIKNPNGEPDSVVDRYKAETKRVFTVLESVLKERKYLVGDKLSVADIAFLQWNTSADRIILGPEFIDSEAPNVRRWMKEMIGRPGIKKVIDQRAKMLA